MRHILIALLLVLMPLQLVWGSVGNYCQHEASANADHLGHHQHKHVQAGDDDDGGGIANTVDGDCDYCHHAGSNLMTASTFAESRACRLAPQPAAERPYHSFIADITHPPDI